MDTTELTRPLEIDEIDFRIQSINKGGYATILAYKDARVDMRRLNEVFGQGFWERKNERIGDSLFCTVSVWNDSIGAWAGVQDVGVPSYTEKAKGEASDAFKRACFNLGIGLELYDYPMIQVKLNDNEFKIVKENGKEKGKATWELKLRDWVWSSFFDADNVLIYLSACDQNGVQRFRWKNEAEKKHRFKAGEKKDIVEQVRGCLGNGDEVGLKQIMDEYKEHEEKMKVFALFSSSERDCMKKLLDDKVDR